MRMYPLEVLTRMHPLRAESAWHLPLPLLSAPMLESSSLIMEAFLQLFILYSEASVRYGYVFLELN